MPLVPLEEIPETDLLPEAWYVLRVRDIVTRYSQSGKMMISPSFQVTEGDYEGQFANVGMYVVGTEDDPSGTEAKTWTTSMGGKQFARLMRACQLNMPIDTDNVEATLSPLKDRTFRALVSCKYDKYYDEQRNSIGSSGYFNPAKGGAAPRTGPVGELVAPSEMPSSGGTLAQSGAAPEPRQREAIVPPDSGATATGDPPL